MSEVRRLFRAARNEDLRYFIEMLELITLDFTGCRCLTALSALPVCQIPVISSDNSKINSRRTFFTDHPLFSCWIGGRVLRPGHEKSIFVPFMLGEKFGVISISLLKLFQRRTWSNEQNMQSLILKLFHFRRWLGF